MKNNKTRELVWMAFYIALFYVLDVVGNMVPFLKMPNGGTIGLSSIALFVASYHLGWKKGVGISIASVFLQFVSGPMYTPDILGFSLDYLIAFGVLGFASIFPNYKNLYFGVLLCNLLRFASSFISGIVVWGVDPWGSFVYQSAYMLPTIIVTMILVPLLWTRIQPLVQKNES